jgi:predicted sulfurtransferase
MYCTGGVRCERASAYLRSKGIVDVHQLGGGIHQYQQDFPQGGYFKGKNFVYDRRIAVPYPAIAAEDDEVVGACQVCCCAYDDYRSQTRCPACRMLVLVCAPCRGDRDRLDAAAGAGTGVLCENCSAAAARAAPGPIIAGGSMAGGSISGPVAACIANTNTSIAKVREGAAGDSIAGLTIS